MENSPPAEKLFMCAGFLWSVTLLCVVSVIINFALPGHATAGPVPGLSLTWPVPSYTQLSQDFAQFNDYAANRYHTGLDIPAPSGTSIVAAAKGTVRLIRLDDPAWSNKTHCFGNVVIVNHDGMASTLYAHLKDTNVSDGQYVSQGDLIGWVGNTTGVLQSGASCNVGIHLHFELKDNPVLGTTTDHLKQTWGYTPELGVTGTQSVAHQPDSYNYHDPVTNLHSGIINTTLATVEVTSSGSGVSMRTGPGANYRSIGSSLVSGQQYSRTREYTTATPGCSAGWYQINKTNGQYFTDTVSGGSLPDVWVCTGDGTESWVLPMTNTASSPPPLSWLPLLLDSPPTDITPGTGIVTVTMQTNMGVITLELDSNKAPLTVANFVEYAKAGFYDNTLFHRVIFDFMIQGGGHNTDMTQKPTNAPIMNEADNGLKNVTGSIAMARTSDPHSATAQFFINLADNSFLDYTAPTSRGWGYAVFGKVTAGMNVVRAIETVPTGYESGHQDVPLVDVVIQKVTVK